MENIVESTTDLLDFLNYTETTSVSVLNEVNVTLVKQFSSQTTRVQLRLYDVLIPIIGITSICLNLLVVISSGLILKKGQQPRSTYLFLGNVAMTDLVTTVAVIFGQLYPKQYRDFTICSLQIGIGKFFPTGERPRLQGYAHSSYSPGVSTASKAFTCKHPLWNILLVVAVCAAVIGARTFASWTKISMIVSSTLASVYSVGLIAIDRFLYITHGLHYQRWVYPLRARFAILFTWVLGLIIGFLPAMGWSGDTNNGQYCWFILLAPKALLILTICLAAVPLFTVVVLYSIILYHALKNIVKLQRARRNEAQVQYISNDKGVNESSSTSRSESELRIFQGRAKKAEFDKDSVRPDEVSESRNIFRSLFKRKTTNVNNMASNRNAATASTPVQGPSKWRAIKVVLFTSGSFVCTWGPYFVASFIYTGCDTQSEGCKSLKILIASPLAILGFINTLINPVIYAWWHKGFRTTVKKHWQSFRRRFQGRGWEGTTPYTVPGKLQSSDSTPSKSTSSTAGTNSATAITKLVASKECITVENETAESIESAEPIDIR